MSYRNPAIIKDESGLIVPNAIAQGMQTIAQGYKEGENRREQVRLAAKKQADKQIAVNTRLEQNYQDSVLDANMSRKNLGVTLQGDAKGLQEEILQDIFEAEKAIYDPNTSVEDRRYYSEKRLAYKTELQGINTAIVKIGVLNDEGKALSVNPSVIGGTVGYNEVTKDGVNDGGKSMLGMDSAFSGMAGQSLNLRRVNGVITLVGGGDIGKKGEPDMWDYSVDMNTFNNDDWDTTHNITQITANGSDALISEVFTEDGKGLSEDYLATDTNDVVTITNELDTNGRPTGRKIRSVRAALVSGSNGVSELEKQVSVAASKGVADFQESGGSLQDQNSILKNQLGITPKEYWALENSGDMDKKAEAEAMLTEAMEKQIISGTGLKLVKENGVTYLDKGSKPFQPPTKKQVVAMDSSELLDGFYSMGVMESDNKEDFDLGAAFGYFSNADILIGGDLESINKSSYNNTTGILTIDYNEIDVKKGDRYYHAPIPYNVKEGGQLSGLLINLYKRRGATAKEAAKAGIEFEKKFLKSLETTKN